jgi:hypothetical protein
VKHFLVTFHETDGNDTTVYDSIVAAEDEDGAFGKVADEIAKRLDTDGRPYSEDGGFGFYFECDHLCATCERDGACSYDCQGHGGIVMREAEGFETEAEAEKAQREAYFHSRFYVED